MAEHSWEGKRQTHHGPHPTSKKKMRFLGFAKGSGRRSGVKASRQKKIAATKVSFMHISRLK